MATVLVAGCLSAAVPARAQSKDEQAIRALEDQFATAASAKDLDAIMKVYVPGNDLSCLTWAFRGNTWVGMITRRTGTIFWPCFTGPSNLPSAT